MCLNVSLKPHSSFQHCLFDQGTRRKIRSNFYFLHKIGTMLLFKDDIHSLVFLIILDIVNAWSLQRFGIICNCLESVWRQLKSVSFSRMRHWHFKGCHGTLITHPFIVQPFILGCFFLWTSNVTGWSWNVGRHTGEFSFVEVLLHNQTCFRRKTACSLEFFLNVLTEFAEFSDSYLSLKGLKKLPPLV